MTCICRTEKTIPKTEIIDVFVPVKGTNAYRLADRFHKKCDVHGIKDLTPPEEDSMSQPPTTEEDNGKQVDYTSPSNAQDTVST